MASYLAAGLAQAKVALRDAALTDGVTSYLTAFRKASPAVSAAGLMAVLVLTVSQVTVMLGFNLAGATDGRPAGRWQRLVMPALVLTTLYAIGATLGFPPTTTVALVAIRGLTGTTIAPMVFTVGLCFFLWL